MTDKTVAETIYKQMGGGRTKMMIGGQYYVCDTNWLSFKFKMCRKTNYVKITLNSMDTYDMEFGKIWGTNYKVVETFNGVYFDQLIPIFEKTTGLYTSLGTMG